jgi:hypothetical protein
LTIVLVVIVGLLVLCRKSVATSPGRLVVATSPQSTPAKVAGLDLSTEPELRQAANEIAAGIRSVKVDRAIAAYQDPTAQERPWPSSAAPRFWRTRRPSWTRRSAAQAQGIAIRSVKAVDAVTWRAGPLRVGGTGRGQRAKVPPACAPGPTTAACDRFVLQPDDRQGANLLRRIRGEILRR